MFVSRVRWSALTAAAVGLLTISGCSRPAPEEHYGPPPPAAATRAPAPELAGGPPAPANLAPSPTEVDSRPLAQIDPNSTGATVVAMAPIPNPGPAARPARRPAPVRQDRPAPPQRAVYNTAPPTQVVAMAPIPNPEDMSRAERRRIYGPRHAAPSHAYAPARPRAQYHAPRRASAPAYTPPRTVRAEPAYRPAPVAKAPAAPRPAAKPAPIARAPVPAAKPAPVAKAPAPVPVKPIVKAPAPAPKVAAAPAAKPTPVAPVTPAQGKLGQLQTAVGGEVARGATLTVGPEIAQGKPGKVSLSLPATLLETLKTEAAKLGLTKAARKAEVSANLSGEGYGVTPNGRQTAALKAGEATVFNWDVAPGPAAKGPLKADVDAALTGQKTPQPLSLASIQSAMAATAETTKKASGFHLPKLKFPSFGSKSGEAAGPPPAPVDEDAAATGNTKPGLLKVRSFPVIGSVSGNVQLAAILGLLAVVILAAVSRNMAKQKRLAERRRRYRTYQPAEDEPVLEPA